MTKNPTDAMFNLPTHTISAEELRRCIPTLPPLRKVKHGPPPHPELMAELRELLKQLHPDRPHPKHPWMHVLIIIKHETAGHPDGFAMADAWSRKGSKYRGPAGVRKYWNSIKPQTSGDPLTIRTLRWMVDEKHGSNLTHGPVNHKEN